MLESVHTCVSVCVQMEENREQGTRIAVEWMRRKRDGQMVCMSERKGNSTNTPKKNKNNNDDNDDDVVDDGGDKASSPCEHQHTVRDFMSDSADAFSSPWIRIFICCLCCFVLGCGYCLSCYCHIRYNFDVNISIKTIIQPKREE